MPCVWAVRCVCVWGVIALIGVNAACADPPAPDNTTFERMRLRHGEELIGRSIEITDGQVLWEFSDGYRLSIPLEDVEKIEVGLQASDIEETPPPQLTNPDDVLNGDSSPGWTESIPLLPQLAQTYDTATTAAAKWTQRLQVGGQFNEGNTRTSLIDIVGVLEQNTPQQMRQIDVGGQFGTNRSTTTANRWWINSNFDWPIQNQDKWIGFVTSKNEYNEPAHLNYRGTLSTGLGYRFFFEDKKRLIVRFGPAYTLEVFASPTNLRDTPDMFGELELRWPITKRLSLEHKGRVQPSVLDMELVRINSTSGLVVDLDEKDRWKLRLGMIYQYNSQPNPGRVPSDYTTTVSLVYVRK